MKNKPTFFEKLKIELKDELYESLPKNNNDLNLIENKINTFLKIKKNEYEGLNESTLVKLLTESKKEILNIFNKNIKKTKNQENLINKIKNHFLNELKEHGVTQNLFGSFIQSEVKIFFKDKSKLKNYPELIYFYENNNKINFSKINHMLINALKKEVEDIKFKPQFVFYENNITKSINICLAKEEIKNEKDQFGHDIIEYSIIPFEDLNKIFKEKIISSYNESSYLITPFNSKDYENLKNQHFVEIDNKLKVKQENIKILSSTELSEKIATEKDLPFEKLKNNIHTNGLFWNYDKIGDSKKIPLNVKNILLEFINNPELLAKNIEEQNNQIKNINIKEIEQEINNRNEKLKSKDLSYGIPTINDLILVKMKNSVIIRDKRIPFSSETKMLNGLFEIKDYDKNMTFKEVYEKFYNKILQYGIDISKLYDVPLYKGFDKSIGDMFDLQIISEREYNDPFIYIIENFKEENLKNINDSEKTIYKTYEEFLKEYDLNIIENKLEEKNINIDLN